MSIQINENDNSEDTFTKLKNYVISLEENQIKNQNAIIIKNEKEKSQLKSDIISLKTAIDIKDQNIFQSKEILSKYKENLSEAETKISNLEIENQRLNYIIIELSQNKNQKNEKSDNINLKIDELEILNKKLEFDNKILEEKILEITTKSQTDLNLYKILKQSEINQKEKIIKSQKEIIEELQKCNNINLIEEYQNSENNLNTSSFQSFIEKISTLENEIQKTISEIFDLKKTNINLNNKIRELEIEIEHKDNMISSIQNITKDNISDFQMNLKEAQCNFTKNEENLKISQIEIQKLLNEKNNILKKNEELNDYVNQFQINFQLLEQSYNNKLNEYSSYFDSLQNKIIDYKKKIKILKLRIDQLFEDNCKLKNDMKISLNYVQNIGNNSENDFLRNFKKNDYSFNDSIFYIKNDLQKTPFFDIEKSLNDYKDFLQKIDFNIKNCNFNK